MASNTPNLDLLKKDPVTDGNDTFNIETMLNENWDKIDAAVGQLEEDMQEIDIPLSDETNGTRSNVAGSEKAVGLVMQAANAANLAAGAAQTKADQAFQFGNERKSEVVAALVALGVSASTSDSWATLISKLTAIIKATGNATAVDVLAGKTFSNTTGNGLQGTMPNQGSKSATLTQQGQQYTIPVGWHNGAGKITAQFANLIPGNIKKGINVGGVVGALQPGGVIQLSYSASEAYVSDKITVLGTLPLGVKRFIHSHVSYNPSGSFVRVDAGDEAFVEFVFGYGDEYSWLGNITMLSAFGARGYTASLYAMDVNFETRKIFYTLAYYEGSQLKLDTYASDVPDSFDSNNQISFKLRTRNQRKESYAKYSASIYGTVMYT